MLFKHKKLIASLLLLVYLVVVLPPLPVYASVDELGEFSLNENGVGFKATNSSKKLVFNKVVQRVEDTNGDAQNTYATKIAATLVTEGLTDDVDAYIRAIAGGLSPSATGADDPILAIKDDTRSMSVLLYYRMFPYVDLEDNADYELCVKKALSKEVTQDLKSLVTADYYMGAKYSKTFDTKMGYADSAKDSYRRLNSDGTYEAATELCSATDITKKMWFATQYAIIANLTDILTYSNSLAEVMIDTSSWESDSNTKETLKWLKVYYDLYTDYFPFLGDVWTHAIDPDVKLTVDGEEVAATLENMCKATGADTESTEPGDYELFNYTYSQNYDKSTPIGDFYIINSEHGIISYDRDKILGNIEVDTSLDEKLANKIEEQRRNKSTILDERLYEENNLLTSDDGEDVAESVNTDSDDAEDAASDVDEDNSFLSKVAKFLGVNDKETYDVDESGNATSTASVTISDHIITGMAYSTTYVPMRTNLYSTEVIASYDKEYRDNFYYKYGFMRKALFIDDSATAAMDYYNAKGKFTGTRSTCTLRQLIDCGDRDVVLYIDPNYYNTTSAVELANENLEARRKTMRTLAAELSLYSAIWSTQSSTKHDMLSLCNDDAVALSRIVRKEVLAAQDEFDVYACTKLRDLCSSALKDTYNFNISKFSNQEDLEVYIICLEDAINRSEDASVNEKVLKTGEYTSYSVDTLNKLYGLMQTDYYNLTTDEGLEADSIDTVVLSNRDIQNTMDMKTTYQEEHLDEEGKVKTTNIYTSNDYYTPLLGFAYTSILYRNSDLFTLANTVTSDNPVFIASDDLCGIDGANQWYRNSLLNTVLIRNLKSAAQVDYNYVLDLDKPVYMDVIGNIVTQSGIVVVPAACNATLHDGVFKNYNISVGTYVNYGKDYSVPITSKGAYSVLAPFFIADLNSGEYVINNLNIRLDGGSLNLSNVSQYDTSLQNVVMETYKNCVVEGKLTNLNWMAMVNIANEVMRGTTIDQINMDSESINTLKSMNKSGLVAAAKLESLINSLKGIVSNTLLKIPDFSRMDSMEFFVAFFIKLMMVTTTAVVIMYVYRDGVSNQLGIRTLYKSLAAVALTFSCIVVVPFVFQLTYYTSNKFLLQNESMRILMLRTDTKDCGVEIGVTENYTPESNNEFAIQLDWIAVPWYKELEDVLYKNSYQNLKKTKLEAYQKSPIYDHSDVMLYDDGIYVSTDRLFDSVRVDYTFNTTSSIRGLYMYSDGSEQTAGFYSPYYAFLRVLLANVNEYNARGEGTYNYTTKLISGNRLKTVGLCYNYFNSTYFMSTTLDKNDLSSDKASHIDYGHNHAYNDKGLMDAVKGSSELSKDKNGKLIKEDLECQEDIMHIYQIYSPTKDERADKTIYKTKKWMENKDKVLNRALLFDDDARSAMSKSLWYNQLEQDDMVKRAQLMDEYAREFVANNRDLLNRVTDETFLKVMALDMAIKYNQLFGIRTANAIEIYNMDSNDILRLSIADHKEAVVAAPMSFARFVYNFGGESSIYAAAILEMIMWVGSFIKPLCTIIVFVSVFMSIFVFRVVLRRPSHNLWGYLVTMLLLSATNVAHAILIKISMKLPAFGLPTLGCIIFVIFSQVVYLLLLGYVTGIALKDWYNLGATEYAESARKVASKFSNNDVSSDLSGAVKHHANNWDYYNDLVAQHRSRNA